MSIKIKTIDAASVVEAINKLPKEVHGKIAYRFGRIGRVLTTELREFEKVRGELLKKYGEVKEDGVSYKLAGENAQHYSDEVTAMLAEEIDVEFDAVKLNDVLRLDDSPYKVEESKRPQIEAAILMSLEPFIIE